MTVDELLEALMNAKLAGRGDTPVLILAEPIEGVRGWLTPSRVVGDEDRTIIDIKSFP